MVVKWQRRYDGRSKFPGHYRRRQLDAGGKWGGGHAPGTNHREPESYWGFGGQQRSGRRVWRYNRRRLEAETIRDSMDNALGSSLFASEENHRASEPTRSAVEGEAHLKMRS